MNVVSIISKYLLDALSEIGAIPDDNDDIIKLETILNTEIDKSHPRVEVTLEEIEVDF